MKKKIVYIADDGEIFETITECIEYEKNYGFNKNLINKIKFYDSNMEIIETLKPQYWQDIFYIQWESSEATRELSRWLIRHSLPHNPFEHILPNEKGIIHWNKSKWEDMVEQYNYYKNFLKNLEIDIE